MKTRIALGKLGEQIARKYLVAKGYKIIGKNFHVRQGEVDIISKFKGTIVFVEVRCKKDLKFGYPEESVTDYKKSRLIKASYSWLQFHKVENADWRIDFVGILLTRNNKIIKINHIVNAVNEM